MSTRVRRFTSLVAVMCALLASPARAQVVEWTVKGDTAAWAEIDAASKKLGSLSGYREKSSTVKGGQVVVVTVKEVVPPNSVRATSEYNNSGRTDSEVVIVNGQGAIRMSHDGRWQCHNTPSDDATKKVPVTVEVARGPDTEIEGAPTRTYLYTQTFHLEGTATWKTTLYVTVQTGMPRRMVESFDGGTETTTDYYDYGATIKITLPTCK